MSTEMHSPSGDASPVVLVEGSPLVDGSPLDPVVVLVLASELVGASLVLVVSGVEVLVVSGDVLVTSPDMLDPALIAMLVADPVPADKPVVFPPPSSPHAHNKPSPTSSRTMRSMVAVPSVDVDADDPRLAPFRDVARRPMTDTVVIEGELAVRRALDAGAAIDTIVCTPAHAQRLESIPSSIDLLVVAHEVLAAIAGFAFHRGVLASMPRPRHTFDPALLDRDRCTIVVAAGLADPANVGAIIRTAHAFAVDLVVTDTDPYTRKAIRASAGHVFAQSIVHERDLATLLGVLARHTELVAATASGPTRLADHRRAAKLTLLVGNEGVGLSPAWLELAHARVRIPMQHDVDSLNVASATAILLWHYAQIDPVSSG